ncbi:uncharacterized protein LOC6617618 [Drosophila sechellia]|uniref:GM11268 n=2 Tax=melanogaster subgroup TaxID=32351 RepID=B4IDX1_DROSE|nr:uncharacterized protein LOC6617618 [Drosophila sechellia]XP_016038860.1 uncharacterized protein LOC6725641 [Drosophila simulans]XP_033170445.1 uncharacterized protein LOC117147605 [Drosophila mauritiana]EDW45779.1 GM11268 [Drosophila sechellia]KMZ09180.1 uncharacterized protein Dsimw501_GD16004 [Drosophila simulans]
MAGSGSESNLSTDSGPEFDSDFGGGGCVYDCCAMAKSITETRTTNSTAATITAIHTRKSTTTIAFVLLLILCCLCDYNHGSWASQCWKKHNSGSIQTPDGEFKRPFGILCTYRCFLWFPPIYPYCEFIFDLRLSRHFTSFPDCYEIRCNETFSFFGKEPHY